MTLQELKYLVAVADHLHFGRAAAACFVTQPTLSAGLRNLEEELGIQLCERGRHGAVIPEANKDVVAQARRILTESRLLGELASGLQNPLAGVIRLGAIPTVGPYLFRHVVPPLREAFPDLALHLKEEKTDSLLEGLRSGNLDAALLSPPLDESRLQCQDLYSERFFLAVPRDHPLAGRKKLSLADLESGPLLLLDEGHCLRDQVMKVCSLPTTPARELVRGSSLETLRAMVAGGVGYSLLPALAVPRNLDSSEQIVIRPLPGSRPQRKVGLYFRMGSRRGETLRGLGEAIRQNLPPGVKKI